MTWHWQVWSFRKFLVYRRKKTHKMTRICISPIVRSHSPRLSSLQLPPYSPYPNHECLDPVLTMYLQSKCTDTQTAIIESGPPTNPPIHGDRLISKHWSSTRGMRTGAQNLFCWDFGGRRVFKCLGRWRRPGLGPWSMGGPWAGTKMMIITHRIPINISEL